MLNVITVYPFSKSGFFFYSVYPFLCSSLCPVLLLLQLSYLQLNRITSYFVSSLGVICAADAFFSVRKLLLFADFVRVTICGIHLIFFVNSSLTCLRTEQNDFIFGHLLTLKSSKVWLLSRSIRSLPSVFQYFHTFLLYVVLSRII